MPILRGTPQRRNAPSSPVVDSSFHCFPLTARPVLLMSIHVAAMAVLPTGFRVAASSTVPKTKPESCGALPGQDTRDQIVIMEGVDTRMGPIPGVTVTLVTTPGSP